MKRLKIETEDLPEDLTLLDDLIKRCYDELLRKMKGNAKLGDLIKMIEFRRKLAPNESDQKRFWQMLEKVRREALADQRDKPPTRRKGKAS